MCLEVYELDPTHFLSLPGLAWQAGLRKTNIKLELLTDYDMLLMVEEGIRGRICHSIHRHGKANNKYMENYNKNEESSYIQYLDTNNLYDWTMSQKVPVNGFKWIEDTSRISEEFIKNYNENNNKGYILEVDVKYPQKLHDLHSNLPFLPKGMKIDKCKKLVCNLLKKICHTCKIIETSIKLMNNAVFGKTMENIRKHRDIKLVTTDKKRSKLVSEPNYHTINYISEDLSIIEMNKVRVKVNKPIYLGLSILDVSKIFMYEFWYD